MRDDEPLELGGETRWSWVQVPPAPHPVLSKKLPQKAVDFPWGVKGSQQALLGGEISVLTQP